MGQQPMADDILLNKARTIERCVKRIREVYGKNSAELENDFNTQDIVILNLQRACEGAIDMAAHLVRARRLGVPQASRDFFELLAQNGLLSAELNKRMQAMVGFRNIAAHDYQKLNLAILRAIIEKHLDDFLAFSAALLKQS